VVLADLEGPGTVTHIWLTVGAPFAADATPPFLRRQTLEVFYGEGDEPSVSVPVPDFFGAVHGVPVSYASSMTTVNEERGFTTRVPMPFRDRIRVEGDERPTVCGTGTEDYLDSAWGLGPFAAPESGAPLVVASGESDTRTGHRLVGFYRWHLSDPVVFERDFKVTVQQIGFRWKGGYYDRQDDWCATAFTYCSEAQAVPRVAAADVEVRS
jgi:hypothetical protein